MGVRNWAGNVRFYPRQMAEPASADEVIELVQRARVAGRKMRVVGAGHSFSPLIATDDIFVSLKRVSGLVGVDRDARRATLLAGTSIHAATRLLASHGLALANQGDIDRQSLAGAFSTGTHGTGLSFASLANFLTAVEFVDGTGALRRLDIHSPEDRLNAAKVAMGVFGILTKVEIQCVESYILRCKSMSVPVEDCLAHLDRHIRENRHFEFFWFPYAPCVQMKMSNPVATEKRRGPLRKFIGEKIVERVAFGGMCEIARMFPEHAPVISRFCGSINPDSDFSEPSYEVFPSERDVIFTEMEYALPLTAGPACFDEIRMFIESHKLPIFFPVEYRVAGADEAWMSPMHGRQSAIISLHTYKGFCQRDFFAGAEVIFKKHGGRPHWGKVHQLDRSELPALYPRWDEFARLRREYDPQMMFCNEMMKRYFS